MDNNNPENLPIVSYSKISCYKTCPKQYKFLYIDKLQRLDKPFTVFGQFCHEALQRFHAAKLAGSKDAPENIMRKSFIEARKPTNDRDKGWKEKITKEQLSEAFAILQTYLNIIVNQEPKDAPEIISVEKKIWLPIDNTLIFYGFIDRIQKDPDGMYHIVDYKTTKDERFLKDRTQLLLYAYSLYAEDNKNIDKIRSSYILLKHDMKVLAMDHEVKELIAAKDKLLNDWEMVMLDKLYRATPLYWKCNNCDCIAKCKEGQALVHRKNENGKVEW